VAIHPYFERREESDGQLADEVDLAIRGGLEYASHVATRIGLSAVPAPDLNGKAILEIGPGLNLGCVLICHALGARVAVVDKYLVRWNEDYHPRFYAMLAEQAAARIPSGDFSAIAAIGADPDRLLELVECESSDVGSRTAFADGQFDATVSNAALEHIADVDGMLAELARVTRPEGVGIHQVDFRDHSHNDRPLDFLTIPDETYAEVFEASNGGGGNRVRAGELADRFRAQGFTVEEIESNLLADADYVESVRPQLLPRWRDLPLEELRRIGARLYVRKTEAISRDQRRLLSPTHDAGHCWIVSLPDLAHLGDCDRESRSPLVLLEDGAPLGPGHTLHDDIRELGSGRYSHWGPNLYFSTSDNSNPLANGRRYEIVNLDRDTTTRT